MANLPEWMFGSQPSSSSRAAGPGNSGGNIFGGGDGDPSRIYVQNLILALQDDHTRESALYHLDKSRGIREDLGPLLWNSVGTVFTLLQEIVAVYRLLSTPNLTQRVSTRVCNALALLQCVASHPETRMQFINANLPLYLYPLLNTVNKERPYEHLRLISLGVIGALVKAGNAEVIHFLLKNQVFPCCLHCMHVGNELSKTVATYIVHKLLTEDEGLKYCCTFAQRFYAIGHALGSMLENPAENPSGRLLKYIIWCYLRLSESPRACDGLRFCLPTRLRDLNIINLLRDDPTAMGWLQQLFNNVATGHQSTTQPAQELLAQLIRG